MSPSGTSSLLALLLFVFLISGFEASAGSQRSLLRSLGDVPDLPDAAVDLNSSNFDRVLKESPAAFAVVEFFAHWCPACRNYKPRYEKVARLFNGPDAPHPGIIIMTRVDCAMKMNIKLCDRFSVGHYPMLLWGPPPKFASGRWDPKQEKSEIQSIDDGRTADRLLSWINKRTGRFGVEVMNVIATWTKKLCANMSQGWNAADDSNFKTESSEAFKDLSRWSVLDIGTGNGLLLQELAKQGFSDLMGTDYSEGAINLARNLAIRDGFPHINFLVDDVLETKLDRKFHVVMDKGTLDAIGLHPDGPIKRLMYWESVSNLVAPGGILVITSRNNTKDELLQEVEKFNKRRHTTTQELDQYAGSEPHVVFRYLDHVRTYPTIMFGGVEGSRVCTVAFSSKMNWESSVDAVNKLLTWNSLYSSSRE